jgi:hypothetical protein
MTDRIMIDIETLGRDPGCVIVSVGAVRWSVSSGVSEEFFVSFDIESCEEHGLSIDGTTLKWWRKQSDRAREQLDGGESLADALQQLGTFVADADEVWANSPAFDCAILGDAYDRVGLDCPWEYYEERDYRTLRETLPTWPDREQESTEHDGLDDARYQAECLAEALRGVMR